MPSGYYPHIKREFNMRKIDFCPLFTLIRSVKAISVPRLLRPWDTRSKFNARNQYTFEFVEKQMVR